MDRVILYHSAVRLVSIANELRTRTNGYLFDTTDQLQEIANDILKAMDSDTELILD